MPIPTNFSTPIRTSAKKRAYFQIQEWIIDGTLHPEEKLNDAELADALGVSRTPIREALQLLNFQGFVEVFPGVGTQVTPINKEDLSKILPPLAVLQALAAELAVPIISQKTIKSLRDINAEFSKSIEKGDFYTALKLDEQFHHIIVDVAENPHISSSISTLQAHVRRLFFHHSITPTHHSIEEHEALLKAFEDKNEEAAARVGRRNWHRPIDEFYAGEGQKGNK